MKNGFYRVLLRIVFRLAPHNPVNRRKKDTQQQ